MKHSITKAGLIAATFAALAVPGQACGQTKTNEIEYQPGAAPKMPRTDKPLWLTDDLIVHGTPDTNGLGCVLKVSNVPWLERDIPPICLLYLDVKSTGVLTFWKADPSSYLEIDLYDAQGIPVARTAEGKKYSRLIALIPLTERIKRQFQMYHSGKSRTDGFTMISSTSREVPFAHFGIGELFVLRVPGYYILKVRMRLVEQVGITYASNPPLKFVLLPEVIAKIELKPGQ